MQLSEQYFVKLYKFLEYFHNKGREVKITSRTFEIDQTKVLLVDINSKYAMTGYRPQPMMGYMGMNNCYEQDICNEDRSFSIAMHRTEDGEIIIDNKKGFLFIDGEFGDKLYIDIRVLYNIFCSDIEISSHIDNRFGYILTCKYSNLIETYIVDTINRAVQISTTVYKPFEELEKVYGDFASNHTLLDQEQGINIDLCIGDHDTIIQQRCDEIRKEFMEKINSHHKEEVKKNAKSRKRG